RIARRQDEITRHAERDEALRGMLVALEHLHDERQLLRRRHRRDRQRDRHTRAGVRPRVVHIDAAGDGRSLADGSGRLARPGGEPRCNHAQHGVPGARPTMRYMTTARIAVVKNNTPETAAVRTSSWLSSMLHSRIGSTSFSGPARNSQTDTLSM